MRLAIAEVGDLETSQRAHIGIAAISNDASRVDEMLAAAASMAGSVRDAVLTHRRTEILPFGDEDSYDDSSGALH